MRLESRDTLGGYRIELCGETKEEITILKDIEQLFNKKDLKFLKSIKSKLSKEVSP